MEKIYSEEQQTCRITKARPETIKFLMGYSRSLQVFDYQNIKFETVLN